MFFFGIASSHLIQLGLNRVCNPGQLQSKALVCVTLTLSHLSLREQLSSLASATFVGHICCTKMGSQPDSHILHICVFMQARMRTNMCLSVRVSLS